MAIWLIRAGAHGEFEQKFIQDKRVYVTWDNLAHDLSKLKDRRALISILEQHSPELKHVLVSKDFCL